MRGTLALCALALLGTACGDDAPVDPAGGGGSGAPGATLWSRAFGRATTFDPVALAADSRGSTVVGGRFFATTDFGKGPVTSPANNYQAYLAKYDGAGELSWLLTPGDIYEDRIQYVGVDDADSIYIAGEFRGAMILGTETLQSVGPSPNPFFAKVSPGGDVQWARQVRAGYGVLTGVVVDGSGAVTWSGETAEDLDLGDGPLGVTGSYLAKLGPDGAVQFAQALEGVGSNSYYYPVGMALDPATGGTVRLGVLYSDVGEMRTQVVHVNPAGVTDWTRELSMPETSVHGLTVSDDGRIFLAGVMYQAFALGGDVSAPPPDEAGGGFVLALALDGTPQWVRTFDADAAEASYDGVLYERGLFEPAALAVAGDTLVVTGTFHGAIDLGGGVVGSVPWGGLGEYDTWSGGADDVFVLGLDAGGEYRWHEVFGGPHAQGATAAAAGADRVVIGGSGQGAQAPYFEGFAVGFRR